MERKREPAHWRYWILGSVVGFLMLYVGSYLTLSRPAIAQARAGNWPGFFYVFPDTPTKSFTNRALGIFYFPANELDCAIGAGMGPAHDPIFRLGN